MVTPPPTGEDGVPDPMAMPPPPPLANDTQQQRLKRFPPAYFNGSVKCASLGNFYATLERLRTSTTTADLALRLHLLQQWLEVHAFIARQGAQEHQFDAVLSGAAPNVSNSTSKDLSPAQADYEHVLDRLERGLL